MSDSPHQATPSAPAGGESLPRFEELGDGTGVVRDGRNELRLSANRQRWWSGRRWEKCSESTPWSARFHGDGQRWWDGVEWRPRARVLRWYERPLVIALSLATGLPILVLLLAGVVSGAVGALLLVVLFLPGAVLGSRSQVMKGSTKGLLLLSVIGVAVLALRQLRSRNQGRGGRRDGHVLLQG